MTEGTHTTQPAEVHTQLSIWRYERSGAIAGVVSVFVFTVIHYFAISDIWNTFIIMAVAGALCGVCLAWSYASVVGSPSVLSWIAYNSLYVVMMVLLMITSVLVFEPVTSVAALIAAGGPPDELIGQALPMTAGFLLIFSIVLSLIYSRSWRGFGVLLLTSSVLVLFLGLNVSVIGLVYVPSSAFYLVGEMLALIIAIGLVFVATFTVLERKSLVRG